MTQLVAAIYLHSWNHLQAEKLQHDCPVARVVHEFAATVILALWSNLAVTVDLAT